MFNIKVITYRSYLSVSYYSCYFMYIIYFKLNTDIKIVIPQAGRYSCNAL
jgi:hypothetical protein